MDETIGTLNLTGATVSGLGTLTVATAINAQSGAVAAGLGGAAGLAKTTAGTATLSGPNSYSGATAVSAGTLIVNGTHTGAGTYTVATNATLCGAGAVSLASGNVTIQAGGTLAPGAALGAGGTLTLGALTMDAGAGLLVDTTTDSVTVSGDLILNDTAVAISDIGSFVKGTRYPLLSYAGTVSGTPALAADYGEWIIRHDASAKTFYLAYNSGTVISIK